ncbi:hypothetical protein [Melittangium boletus]|uniref:Uncharacterized protein n=1 Tax=Melittangium boletus DSM 14713 TaxID=1294270 RepID=A0A250ISJ4_9BACT|nr:hypothetical protein [Melittangium boletus]ATB34212.1 hypothetical protein MEBOL_007713 [Melittangium boletus DSM 14713]
MRLRYGLLLGAACVLLLALGLWGTTHWREPGPLPAGPAPQAGAVRPPVATETPPPVASVPPPRRVEPRPPVATPPVREAPPPPPPSEPAPEQEVLPPGEDTRADRYEPQDGGEPEIRTLLAVGDIRIGVARGAEIHDEAGLKKVLVRIGDDLERRMREARPRGEGGPQQVLDDYREELGQYMRGDVEMRGPEFMIGTEVGPPLPREKWWKPRQQ